MPTRHPPTTIALLWLSAVLLLSACSSGGDDAPATGGDTTAPTAVVTPDSGTTINAGISVVIRFNESMDTSSLVLGGSMVTDSDGGTWSTTTVANDTLTISPTDDWSTGNASLTVAANDVAGNALSPLNLAYAIPLLLLNTFQPASIVIGQADFISNAPNQGGLAGANTLSNPTGAPSPGSLYLADQLNHRILGFNAIPEDDNANADFVIGQADFTTSTLGTAADKLAFPASTATADGRLFVVDLANHRVLIWNSLPTGNVPADVVLGQPDFTSNQVNQGGLLPGANTLAVPVGVSVAGERLIVSEQFNNRVLIWNTIPTNNNAPADVVLGQADFTGNEPNRGRLTAGANTLSGPQGVWSDGQRLAVADMFNNRVLIWNSIPTTNDVNNADLVIGQPDFASTAPGSMSQSLSTPVDVYSNGLQFFISDADNHRVLIFGSFPTDIQPAADRVLGQNSLLNITPNDDNQDGVEDANASARTLRNPTGIIAIGNRLFVTDFSNNRVLIYEGN